MITFNKLYTTCLTFLTVLLINIIFMQSITRFLQKIKIFSNDRSELLDNQENHKIEETNNHLRNSSTTVETSQLPPPLPPKPTTRTTSSLTSDNQYFLPHYTRYLTLNEPRRRFVRKIYRTMETECLNENAKQKRTASKRTYNSTSIVDDYPLNGVTMDNYKNEMYYQNEDLVDPKNGTCEHQTLYPPSKRYLGTYNLWLKHQSCFWSAHENDPSVDRDRFMSLTPQSFQKILLSTVGCIAIGDSVVLDRIASGLRDRITVIEVKAMFADQESREFTHKKMYNHMLEVSNEAEYYRSEEFRKKYMGHLSVLADRYAIDDIRVQLYFIMMCEMILFAPMFQTICYAATKGYCPKLCDLNLLVMRDEHIHYENARLLLSNLKHKLNIHFARLILDDFIAMTVRLFSQIIGTYSDGIYCFDHVYAHFRHVVHNFMSENGLYLSQSEMDYNENLYGRTPAEFYMSLPKCETRINRMEANSTIYSVPGNMKPLIRPTREQLLQTTDNDDDDDDDDHDTTAIVNNKKDDNDDDGTILHGEYIPNKELKKSHNIEVEKSLIQIPDFNGDDSINNNNNDDDDNTVEYILPDTYVKMTKNGKSVEVFEKTLNNDVSQRLTTLNIHDKSTNDSKITSSPPPQQQQTSSMSSDTIQDVMTTNSKGRIKIRKRIAIKIVNVGNDKKNTTNMESLAEDEQQQQEQQNNKTAEEKTLSNLNSSQIDEIVCGVKPLNNSDVLNANENELSTTTTKANTTNQDDDDNNNNADGKETLMNTTNENDKIVSKTTSAATSTKSTTTTATTTVDDDEIEVDENAFTPDDKFRCYEKMPNFKDKPVKKIRIKITARNNRPAACKRLKY